MDNVEKKAYKVAPFPGSDKYDLRFCVIDPETGEVLDDAQGCGYKSAQSAHRAWAYKSQSTGERAAKEAKHRAIWNWLKQHKNIENWLNAMEIDAYKGCSTFTVKDVDQMLKRANLDFPYSGRALLNAWRKGPPKRQEKKRRKR